MKINCNIIQDILPIAIENLASEDTMLLVNEHIKNCPRCYEEYNNLKKSKADYKSIESVDTIPLKSIKMKLKNKNIYTAVLSALVICLLLIITLNIATKPIPISYEHAIESIKIEDNKLFIKFNPVVSNYSISSSNLNHDIMAWRTNISNFFNISEAKNTVIDLDNNNSTVVHYITQTNKPDKLIYGKVDYKGQITLPRLSINYYFLTIVSIFIISILLYLLFKNNKKIKKILKISTIFSLSYILGYISIFGHISSTHHITRYLFFVVLASILFFSIIILLVYKDYFLNLNSNIDK